MSGEIQAGYKITPLSQWGKPPQPLTVKVEPTIDIKNATAHIFHDATSVLASAECRLPESLHFTECDVILGVVRARSVHKIGYGHNRDWSAA